MLAALQKYDEVRKLYDESLTIEEIKLVRTVWLDYANFEIAKT